VNGTEREVGDILYRVYHSGTPVVGQRRMNGRIARLTSDGSRNEDQTERLADQRGVSLGFQSGFTNEAVFGLRRCDGIEPYTKAVNSNSAHRILAAELRFVKSLTLRPMRIVMTVLEEHGLSEENVIALPR